MARCARGTCSRGADAGLGYDPVRRSVWLIDLPGDEQQVLALCAAHADNLTVPHGWTSQDERTGSPRLWSLSPAAGSPPSSADTERPRARRPARLDHARARRQIIAEPLELFGDDDADTADETSDEQSTLGLDDTVVDVAAVDDTNETRRELGARTSLIPGTDGGTAPDELHVDEGTPLLARAFRATRHAG
jgi:hypothetical protein